MDEAERAVAAQRFLHHRPFTDATREAYGLSLRNLFTWSDETQVPIELATPADLWGFREWLRGRNYLPNTVNTRFKNVRSFYEYLRRTGVVSINPTIDIEVVEVGIATRNVLSFEELGRMWDTTSGPDRIVVGLLALCALRRSEVTEARAEDLHKRGRTSALAIRSRVGKLTDVGAVSLPQQLADEIEHHLAGRRTGFLLQTERGRGLMPVAKTFVDDAVRRAATSAELPFKVTALTLTQTLRYLAMENGFSYASVVRTASHGSVKLRSEMVRNLDLPPEDHASAKLGRMLAARTSADEQMLVRAEELLSDRSQHPVSALMLASATLERVLREVTASSGVAVSKKDPTLNTYATLLRSRDLIGIGHVRTLDRILGFRNHAAHGWFDEVSRADAEWVLGETRTLIPMLRGLPTASA